MAKRRVTAARRRSLIALVLVGFVLVTTGVIARRVVGVRQQGEIRALQAQRDALDAKRVRLESAIRDASSRERLEPIAEQRLNMHIPTPEQQIFLTHTRGSQPQPARDSL
jgi:cell division protein FtsL